MGIRMMEGMHLVASGRRATCALVVLLAGCGGAAYWVERRPMAHDRGGVVAYKSDGSLWVGSRRKNAFTIIEEYCGKHGYVVTRERDEKGDSSVIEVVAGYYRTYTDVEVQISFTCR